MGLKKGNLKESPKNPPTQPKPQPPQPKPQPPKPGPPPHANARCSGRAYTIVDRPAATINVTATLVLRFIVLEADITCQYISDAPPLVLELLEKLWIY
jgi:hypothetical protein